FHKIKINITFVKINLKMDFKGKYIIKNSRNSVINRYLPPPPEFFKLSHNQSITGFSPVTQALNILV
ncbi:MAG: hypothetical protein FWH23_04850, partial [Bacteroidales bacterium]|nr:hypothetical protein [Bacteroidales bacterium]